MEVMKMEQVGKMWNKQSKLGRPYWSGKVEFNIVAFRKDKHKPEEPEFELYFREKPKVTTTKTVVTNEESVDY